MKTFIEFALAHPGESQRGCVQEINLAAIPSGKPQTARWLACLMPLLLSLAGSTQAQPFTPDFSTNFTGTTDLVVNVNTNIALPTNGILHYRNIIINSGATLTFSNNVLNTPVYLLAAGNVLINANGTIDVSGKPGNGRFPGEGGPGGFRGGIGATAAGPLGDGKGPGGGKGSFRGGSGCSCCDYGYYGLYSYGNVICTPLVGGSGAAGAPIVGGVDGGGGGGGGGAILIAANGSITNSGLIRSLGGNGGNTGGCGFGGAGSGGAIRLVAPLVTGSGFLDVGGSGGPGRMRIDSATKPTEQTINMRPVIAGIGTIGSQSIVFPQNNRLTITNVTVGAQTYPINPLEQAIISLPAGSATNAVVQVVASGPFYGAVSVPIAVVVTPENGPSGTYTNAVSLLNSNGIANVSVTIPAGTVSTLHVWTR